MATYEQLRRREMELPGRSSTTLRIHRALSWLRRAGQSEDSDGRFVFLWIAFNAAYGNEYDASQGYTETRKFREFIRDIVDLDRHGVLEEMVCKEFAESIVSLINNKFVLKPFWDQVNATGPADPQGRWQRILAHDRNRARRALKDLDTAEVLTLVFHRLYVLRNQIIHGGATWNSSINRSQVDDGAEFLGKLVPRVIEILLDLPTRDWGQVAYPPIEG